MAINWTDESNWTPEAKALLAEFAGREGVVAATGHRPPRLGLSYSRADLVRLCDFAKPHLLAIKPSAVVSGGAQGWDTAVGWAAVQLKLPLLVAEAFPSQSHGWPADARRRYDALLARATRVVQVCPESPKGSLNAKYIGRDHFMVRLAANGAIIALWDGGQSGGTAATVSYARRLGVPVTNLWRYWTSPPDAGRLAPG